MSPEFQATLSDNPMTSQARDIHFYDVITIKHKDTKAYLHSHAEHYPLRYDDGRISSQGQQVTGYPFNDTNNHWLILPSEDEPVKQDRPVHHKDVVKLRHIGTNTDLLTHDVASPYYPTNQEFTTVELEESWGERHNDTLFTVEIENGKVGETVWRTRAGLFKLIHVPTRVAMWTHTKALPEWAFQQQEINGNKNILQSSNIWFVEDIIGLQDECFSLPLPKQWWLTCSAFTNGGEESHTSAILVEISRTTESDVLSQQCTHIFPSIRLSTNLLAIPTQRSLLLDQR